MKSGKVRPEVTAAVEWWANIISGIPKQDNGAGGVASFLAALQARDAPRPTPEQLTIFKRSLADWVSRALEKDPTYVFLDVDYDPCKALRDAAMDAKISIRFCGTFPMKTCMWIEAGRVAVRYGYGAEEKVIYGE